MATPIAPETRIGHVHLKVADLDRAIGFYSGVLGFEVMQRYGAQAAFLSAGGYHHHLGLNTWESRGGTPAPRGHTGLYHTAILYPDRAALADALRRLVEAGVALDGAVLSIDDRANEAVYGQDTTPRMIFEDRTAPPSPMIESFRERLADASATAHAARRDDGAPVAAQTTVVEPVPARVETQPQPFEAVDNPAKVEALPDTP